MIEKAASSFEALRDAIASAQPEDLPGLIGALEQARADAWARLVSAAARPPALRLLTVDEAAAIARLPSRRIFSLSRSAPWAVRIGRRLLIEEAAFRRALLSGDVRRRRETTRAGGSGPSEGARRVVSCTPVTRARLAHVGKLRA